MKAHYNLHNIQCITYTPYYKALVMKVEWADTKIDRWDSGTAQTAQKHTHTCTGTSCDRAVTAHRREKNRPVSEWHWALVTCVGPNKVRPSLHIRHEINLTERSGGGNIKLKTDGNFAKWLWCQDEFFKHDTQKAQTIKEKAENADRLEIKTLAGTGAVTGYVSVHNQHIPVQNI